MREPNVYSRSVRYEGGLQSLASCVFNRKTRLLDSGYCFKSSHFSCAAEIVFRHVCQWEQDGNATTIYNLILFCVCMTAVIYLAVISFVWNCNSIVCKRWDEVKQQQLLSCVSNIKGVQHQSAWTSYQKIILNNKNSSLLGNDWINSWPGLWTRSLVNIEIGTNSE